VTAVAEDAVGDGETGTGGGVRMRCSVVLSMALYVYELAFQSVLAAKVSILNDTRYLRWQRTLLSIAI
jgi:hypothetical protein